MWGVPTAEKKRALRAAALSRRNSLAEAEFRSRSLLIQGRVLKFPPYLNCRAVALYSSIQNEVATDQILDGALTSGKSVFYPRLGGAQGLELVRVHSPAELQVGRFGIREPVGGSEFWPRSEELLVLVPGVAFDLSGNRLGRGQGWYDRLLGQLRDKATFVGLSYEFQIVAEVLADEWDQRVDFLVSETRLIDCGAKKMEPYRET